MTDNKSICVYHNGNSRVIDFYKNKFRHLKFSGNLAETDRYSAGCLWEVCFADATPENLFGASVQNVSILRHISTLADDQMHRLPECESFDHDRWLTQVVINGLGFSDHVVTDFHLAAAGANQVAIITTGRTANQHFQQVLETFGSRSFENDKTPNSDGQIPVDDRYYQSGSAVLMWRKDQWECLTSIWIAKHIGYNHQLKDGPRRRFDHRLPRVSPHWIEQDWLNMCRAVFDHALFFKYLLGRPVHIMTTERAIDTYQSNHERISYDKKTMIDDYAESKVGYGKSMTAQIVDLLYSRAQQHLNSWQEPSQDRLDNTQGRPSVEKIA